MDMIMYPVLALIGGLVFGLAGGFFLRRKVAENQFRNLQNQGKQIIENAIVEAEQRKKERGL